jgi:hypothetical protein
MTDLINDIEKLRNELYLLLDSKELTDIKVVICSRELDKLIVQYEKGMNLKLISKAV